MNKSLKLFTRLDFITRRHLAVLVLLGLGLALFFSVYDGVREQADLATFDKPLLAWTIAHQNAQLTSVMRLITDLLSPVALGGTSIIIACIWAWRKRQYWRPVLLVGGVSFAFILSAIIKASTARARPTLTDLITSPGAISYSFPSGHTIGVAALLLILSYFFYVMKPSAYRLAIGVTATAFGVLLVAFSRIYLGYHWLTDVTASVGLAVIVLAIVILVDTYERPIKRLLTSSKVV
jgi:membrane-associated phospholipid phosphatase